MKKLFLILLTLPNIIYSQLPYIWSANTNPGWTSTNVGTGGALTWNAGCNSVTTNCNGQYSNNQNTTYTSFILDASCTNASTVNISFSISGNAENGWDFLFMEYSLDGGVTWVNPYGANVGLTGNAGAGILWTLPPIPTSNTFRFRFNFTSDASVRASGYKITDFQISCNVVLPIELITFIGRNIGDYNYIEWVTSSEIDSDFFILERSNDGLYWVNLVIINGAGNSSQPTFYSYKDFDFEPNINFYKLTQVDIDGTNKQSFVITINNINKKIISIKYYSIIGAEQPNISTGGLFVVVTEFEFGIIETKTIYIH
jgi:hypothetical protein